MIPKHLRQLADSTAYGLSWDDIFLVWFVMGDFEHCRLAQRKELQALWYSNPKGVIAVMDALEKARPSTPIMRVLDHPTYPVFLDDAGMRERTKAWAWAACPLAYLRLDDVRISRLRAPYYELGEWKSAKLNAPDPRPNPWPDYESVHGVQEARFSNREQARKWLGLGFYIYVWTNDLSPKELAILVEQRFGNEYAQCRLDDQDTRERLIEVVKKAEKEAARARLIEAVKKAKKRIGKGGLWYSP